MAHLFQDLSRELREYERTPDGQALRLRLDLSRLILKGLRRKEWTQRQLAEAAGVKQSFITRLVHAESNCTFESATKVLAALEVQAQLNEAERAAVRGHASQAAGGAIAARRRGSR